MICCDAVMPGHQHSLSAYQRFPDPRARLAIASIGMIEPDIDFASRLIEKFVDYLIRTDREPFKPGFRRGGESTITTTRLGKAIFQVLPLLGLFSSDRNYSARVYVFLDACWCLERQYGVDFLAMAVNPAWAIETHGVELEYLIDKMRISLRAEWFWVELGGRNFQTC